jgi:ketosteroid isomerase-like protein
MSEEAVEAARRIFDRASRVKDPSGRAIDVLDPDTLTAIYESFDPEIEVHEDPSFPEAGTYRGVDAVTAYFTQFSESFDEFTFEVEEIIDLGDDRVLLLFHIRNRGKESGAVTEASPGWIQEIRNGRITYIEAYIDRNEALAAAGVQ